MNYTAFCSMCFLLFGLNLQAQNLVPNGSFEYGDPCPTTLAGVYYLDHWYLGVELPFPDNDWWNWPSPDWYSQCSPNPDFQPPNVIGGFQEPFLERGYVGIITYVTNVQNGREVVSVELLEELEIGETYTFTMSVVRSPAEVAVGGSTNGLGMKLSTFSHWTFLEGPALSNSAHFWIEEVLVDTTNWHTYTAEIVADSAYRYLHLGNFFDDDHTIYEPTPDGYPFIEFRHPYYFVDDVSLVKQPLSVEKENPKLALLTSFPNPSTGIFHIKCAIGLHSLRIFDINGKNLMELAMKGSKEQRLDLTTWSSGVYFMNVTDEKGENHNLKLLKN